MVLGAGCDAACKNSWVAGPRTAAELKEAAKQLEALKLEAQSEREAAEGAKKKTAEAKAKLAEASAREEQSKKALEALKAQLDVSQKAGARDKDAASEVGAFRRE